MSTKIYEAYRIPINRLCDFTNWFNDVCYSQTKDRFDKILAGIDYSKFVDWYKGDKTTQHELFWEFPRWMYEVAFKPASESEYKDPFNLDYGYWAYIVKSFIYLVPDLPEYMFYTLINLGEIPDYVEEYAYWNNSDRPDNVTQKEWRNRERSWDTAFKQPCLYWAGLNCKSDYSKFLDLYFAIMEIGQYEN